MGKNGDQIQRLFEAPAEAFVVQYCRQIDLTVLAQMRQLAIAKSLMTGTRVLYGVIDGTDSRRIVRAYPTAFKTARGSRKGRASQQHAAAAALAPQLMRSVDGGASRMSRETPWVAGPAEILAYAIRLLGEDNDSGRRLAMILADNAVELTIRTFLSLPKRITGVKMARKELQDSAETFPGLLDCVERYAGKQLQGVDLGVIEWHHQLRNQLYHHGNGLTVAADTVHVYVELRSCFSRTSSVPKSWCQATTPPGSWAGSWNSGYVLSTTWIRWLLSTRFRPLSVVRSCGQRMSSRTCYRLRKGEL